MKPVVVQIVNKSPYPLPSYMTMQSAGMDICANIPTPIYLEPLERRLIPRACMFHCRRVTRFRCVLGVGWR